MEAEDTGNNFGSLDEIQMGIVLKLGEFEGKINKLAYMVPEYFNPPFTWKIVEIITDGNNIEWTDNILVSQQNGPSEMVYFASSWTEIDVESDVNLSTEGISWFLQTSIQEWV